jgi:hypothetical protein
LNSKEIPVSLPVSAESRRFGLGAISGWLVVFLAIASFQIAVFRPFEPLFLIVAAISATLFGLLPGGIGGLILGSIWEHSKAPVIGGVIATVLFLGIFLSVYRFDAFCALMGGC